MRDFLKQKLRQVSETHDTMHLSDRLVERLSSMNDEDITPEVKQRIIKNLEITKKVNFPVGKGFAILLGSFKINPKSKLFVDVNGRGYYRIIDLFGKDSTGDQIWAVVRDNSIVTLMLRKRIQSQSEEFIKEKVRVNKVIFNIESYFNSLIGDKNDITK
jgi:hypothetical protein